MDTSLANYSLIGNSRAAALVSRSGSIDWCCLPEFHSPSIFASLLDKEKGGFLSISPTIKFTSRQQYISDTNVIETYFETEEGVVRLTDCFSVIPYEKRSQTLFPEHEILRLVEGISGSVNMKMEYVPRPFFGQEMPGLENRKKLGVHFCWKDNIYTLLTTLDPELILVSEDKSKARSEFLIMAGDFVCVSLSYSNNCPTILPELKVTGRTRINDTVQYWKNWISKCNYSGFYEEQIRRSALVLKLLAHAPSGAIIAAPTTSLPEEIGGERNWDYRFCWLRDASFTVNVLISLGFEEEAHSYMNWIIHATRLTRPKLQVVYSVYGITSLKEKYLEGLTGYKNSLPVRIGNEADRQFQLDLYGEVLQAIYSYSQLIKEFDYATKKFIIGLGEAICELWDKPDNGIWEIRSAPVHHTHSKVMAWIGLDRIITLAEKYGWKIPLDKYRRVAEQIYALIENFGYNENLKTYTRELNGHTLDASLLTLPIAGYCDYNSPRMISTRESICKVLSKNKLLYRYFYDDDGISGDEGSFGICNFWLAKNYAKSGDVKTAIDIFETMLQYSSPTGLFSEEVNPETGELLGNYPQGFTHIGLINAALSINESYEKGRRKK